MTFSVITLLDLFEFEVALGVLTFCVSRGSEPRDYLIDPGNELSFGNRSYPAPLLRGHKNRRATLRPDQTGDLAEC